MLAGAYMEYEVVGGAPSYTPFQAGLILLKPGKTPKHTPGLREVLFVLVFSNPEQQSFLIQSQL